MIFWCNGHAVHLSVGRDIWRIVCAESPSFSDLLEHYIVVSLIAFAFDVHSLTMRAFYGHLFMWIINTNAYTLTVARPGFCYNRLVADPKRPCIERAEWPMFAGWWDHNVIRMLSAGSQSVGRSQ